MKPLIDLIDAIRKLAANYPDAVYANGTMGACSYSQGAVTNGPERTGCIVGQAAALIGVSNQEIEHGGETGYGEFLDTLAKNKWLDTDSKSIGDQYDWIGRVQERQDSGVEWGEAVKSADHHNPID